MPLHHHMTPLIGLAERVSDQNAKLKRSILALENIAFGSSRANLERVEEKRQLSDLIAQIGSTALEIADVLQSLDVSNVVHPKVIRHSAEKARSLSTLMKRRGADQYTEPDNRRRSTAKITPFQSR